MVENYAHLKSLGRYLSMSFEELENLVATYPYFCFPKIALHLKKGFVLDIENETTYCLFPDLKKLEWYEKNFKNKNVSTDSLLDSDKHSSEGDAVESNVIHDAMNANRHSIVTETMVAPDLQVEAIPSAHTEIDTQNTDATTSDEIKVVDVAKEPLISTNPTTVVEEANQSDGNEINRPEQWTPTIDTPIEEKSSEKELQAESSGEKTLEEEAPRAQHEEIVEAPLEDKATEISSTKEMETIGTNGLTPVETLDVAEHENVDEAAVASLNTSTTDLETTAPIDQKETIVNESKSSDHLAFASWLDQFSATSTSPTEAVESITPPESAIAESSASNETTNESVKSVSMDTISHEVVPKKEEDSFFEIDKIKFEEQVKDEKVLSQDKIYEDQELEVVLGSFVKDQVEKTISKRKIPFEHATFEVDEKSIDNETFVSETMALLYAEQGLNAKAIELYKKLIIRIPEKSVFFANQIDKLK